MNGTAGKEEKRKELFRNQKELLDLFLENGAISRAQYDKSLGDLIVKMGMEKEYEKLRSLPGRQ